MTHVSHHDETRTAVGQTAIGVAGLRAMESMKPVENRLIFDEFAVRIAAKYPVEDHFVKNYSQEKLDAMINGLAVRTRKIDEEIIADLDSSAQVVVIGAGLDFRPWRLHQYFEGNEEKLASLASKKWFEIDFKEILDFKTEFLTTSADSSAVTSKFNYNFIVGNACTDDWGKALFDHGFDAGSKTIWLLEGFTGYLTEEEVRRVFTTIKEVSAVGSKMIATFLGPNYKAALDMHRFKTDRPAEFLTEWSWKSEEYDFPTLMETKYNRSSNGLWDDYRLVSSYLE